MRRTKEQLILDLNTALDFYKDNNITVKNCSIKFNIDRHILSNYFKSKGIKINPNGKQNINSNIFNTIDTEEKAYWLGFIYADGSVSERGNLTICLSKKDTEILEFIKEELNYSGVISSKLINKNEYSLLSIDSKVMVNRLIELGIVPNKSLILDSFQNKIPNEFFNSFLLGYFDGDGSIYKTSTNKYYIQIRGTKNLLEDYNKFLKLDYEIKKYDSTYNLTIGSKSNIIKFISLYENNNIFLNRKKEKFNSFLKEKCQDKTISSPLT